ncbi:Ring hydroxylating alpha subunit (catalytic domain) [Fragilaria crotonensis]|nr:Ring hydroxylating alpha subunit (catalytic domain) [Fragilaria crotonensis]
MGFQRCIQAATTVATTTWYHTALRPRIPLVGPSSATFGAMTLTARMSSSPTAVASNNRDDNHDATARATTTKLSAAVQHEIGRYDPSIPIGRAETPPSSWYTWPDIMECERNVVFCHNWVAVDILRATKPGSFQTGIFNEQPYLITNNINGEIKAFYNVCTHAGSCLVGPWTNNPTCRLTSELGLKKGRQQQQQYHYGELDEKQERRGMQCPYHGWQFNLDGKLIKTTQMKGIEDFRNKNYDLRTIEMMVVGPIVYMKFQKDRAGSTAEKDAHFLETVSLFEQRVERNGFVPDFTDLQFIESSEYTVDCNWKVFVDNYGDGCYHCAYAHKDLSANIDEASYFTDLVSPELSIQNAPPKVEVATTRFGTDRPAIYAYMYPNIMYNRYGPWLDVDIIKPLTATTCSVIKAWFLERSFGDDRDAMLEFIDESIKSSRVVHDEDVFLCENVQTGMGSYGFDRGRYVPEKQIASYHFHQRLAADLRRTLQL